MNLVGMTMEWIKSKCIEDGDCWNWTMATSPGGFPKYNVREGDRCRSLQVRRVVWELTHDGRQLGKHQVTACCGNKVCLNPDHLAKRTKSEVIRAMSAQPQTKAKKFLAGIKNRQGRIAKLDMEKARYIRASDKTLITLAEELGVSPGLVSKVRRGEAWKEIQVSPWSGLFAMNDSMKRAA